MKIEIRRIHVDRWSVTSSRLFDEIISELSAAIEAAPPGELSTLGPSRFMEFVRFDPGNILAKELDGSLRIRRLAIGNPLVMKEMVKHVPDAASYALVTVLIVEGFDSVRLSYDTMASLIASYGSAEALEIARDLDQRLESLILKIVKI